MQACGQLHIVGTYLKNLSGIIKISRGQSIESGDDSMGERSLPAFERRSSIPRKAAAIP